jgi:DNA-binding MarR family transcriptional regulator
MVPRPAPSATPSAADAAVDEAAVSEFLDAGRALVGIAVQSVNAAPVELTVTQYRLLAVVGASGSLAITEVGVLLGVVQSNATRHCDRLQRLGLLERHRSEQDRRLVLVRLTDPGREVVEFVTELRRRQIRTVLASMSRPARKRALRAVGEFNRAAGAVDEHPWLRAAW